MSNGAVSVLKPQPLLSGVTIDDIKSLPKVRVVLESLLQEARDEGYAAGHAEGYEVGISKSRVEYDSINQKRIDEEFDAIRADFEFVKDVLASGVSAVKDQVLTSFRTVVLDAIMCLAEDPTVYESKVERFLLDLVDSGDAVSIDCHVEVSSKASSRFVDLVGAVLPLSKVSVIEMSDFIRIHSDVGNYRCDPADAVKRLLS